MVTPKLIAVRAERRRDPEGFFEVVGGPLDLALEATYSAEEIVTLDEQILISFARGEVDRSGRGFFYSTELIILTQEGSNEYQRSCLSRYVIELLVKFQRFFRLLDRILSET